MKKTEVANQKENVIPGSTKSVKTPKISTYNRDDFLEALVENHKDLRVEKGYSDKEYTEEPQIEWQTLQCPTCTAPQENTRALIEHLVNVHGSDEDQFDHRNFQTVTVSLNQTYEEVVQRQSERSWVKRRFLNSEDVISCPVNSPLAPFLAMRHLQVYSGSEENPGEGFELKVKNSNDDGKSKVIFCWQKIEKIRQKIRKEREEKRIQKRLKYLHRECGPWIEKHDIVTKRTRRTAEEQKLLAKALNLAPKFTQEDLMGKMDEIREEIEREEKKEKEADACNLKPTGIKADGTKMSAEEMKLHSALVNIQVSGKRRKPTVTKETTEESVAKKQKK